jgi:hypothetical protein
LQGFEIKINVWNIISFKHILDDTEHSGRMRIKGVINIYKGGEREIPEL